MRHTLINGIAVLTTMFVMVACGNGGSTNNNTAEQDTGTKFAPQERTSSMTAEQRKAAIAEKKAELNVDPVALLDRRNIRISILQPLINGDITESVADRISMKMLEIASQNGISGLGTNPNIVMGAEINQTGRTATGTAPQKMTVQYEMLFKVMNAASGDVYGVTKQEVTGVGNSFEEASFSAVNEIKNTAEMQNFLKTSSERIIEWYESNVTVLKNEVEKAEAAGNYAYALALLGSVPEQATVAYQYVSEKQPQTLSAMLHKQAADMLGEMEAVLASSNDDFNPAVGAYLSLIPMDSPEHAAAQKLYAEYEKKNHARRNALEAKAERDEQAARELQKLQMQYENQQALAEIEADKIRAKYEAQAASAAAANRPRGLLGSIGYAIAGTADRLFKAFDNATNN